MNEAIILVLFTNAYVQERPGRGGGWGGGGRGGGLLWPISQFVAVREHLIRFTQYRLETDSESNL